MTAHHLHRFAVPAAALCCLLGTACAINPATGKRQLTLVSERQEIEIGRENDKAIIAQMGLYDDEALQAYVQELGHHLASRSERPDLDWTFRVVDDPVINAFALPGGYIYVTRGILAHMSNEAELASVVGHEIGHVTARHSVSQMSKAQLAQFGLSVGTIIAPERAERFGSLAEAGLGLVFLKYGRDDERQADDLGLRYMVVGGYDPRPMADMFDMLDRVSASSGGGRTPAWMSTHPAPENRRARAESKIAALDRDFTGWTVDREEFLERIDGIAFGDDPRQGYFKENRFVHPDMRFRIDFPEGWKLQNLRQAVAGASPEKDAVIQLTLSDAETPEAALQDFFSGSDIRSTGPNMGSISGLRTAGDGFVATTDQGNLQGRIGFVAYGSHVFQLLGYSVEHRWSTYEDEIRRTLASFDKLTDPRALAVQPKRLKVVRVDRSMTLAEFASLHRSTVPIETLALLNRLDADSRLAPGKTYKVIVGGDLP
jgi:predicted Zn-dependent protease